MENNRKYAGLEISSRAIKLVIGYVLNNTVYVLHALETEIDAIHDGVITEEDEVIRAIKGLIDSANKTLKLDIKEVVVSLPPIHLHSVRESRSTNTISSDDVVAQIDINNAISQLRKVKFSEGLEIIDVIPHHYVLENRDSSEFAPIGKTSSTLTLYASIYAINSRVVQMYKRVITGANLTLLHFALAPYSASLYIASAQNMPSNYILLNFGAEVTTLSYISQKTSVIQNECFRFGSSRLDEAIASRFAISKTLAKELKETYGIDKSPAFIAPIAEGIELDELGKVITGTLDVLCDKINETITNWLKDEVVSLPIVLIGGGSYLYGLKAYLHQKIDTEIYDFYPDSFGARNKGYVTCLGLIKYGTIFLDFDQTELDLSTVNLGRVTGEEVKESTKKVKYNFNDEL